MSGSCWTALSANPVLTGGLWLLNEFYVYCLFFMADCQISQEAIISSAAGPGPTPSNGTTPASTSWPPSPTPAVQPKTVAGPPSTHVSQGGNTPQGSSPWEPATPPPTCLSKSPSDSAGTNRPTRPISTTFSSSKTTLPPPWPQPSPANRTIRMTI